MTRLLHDDELARHLADLPGVTTGASGSLVLAVRTSRFADAITLVQRVGALAEELDHHPDLDLRWCTVTFTLSTHSAGGVTELDVELARRILAVAAELSARPLPPPQRVEIALDCQDVEAALVFWAAALAYRKQPSASGGWQLHDPGGRGPVVWFQAMSGPRAGRGRFHLDVYVPDDEAPGRVQACLDAGGRLVTDAFAPSWWVLADPEGNEVCVCTRASLA